MTYDQLNKKKPNPQLDPTVHLPRWVNCSVLAKSRANLAGDFNLVTISSKGGQARE
jgi:hypothetical protein